MEYAFATFCFGDRYQKQTNRLIESLEKTNIKKAALKLFKKILIKLLFITRKKTK